MTDVPLLCATEIAVPGAMPRVLRLLAHVETDRSPRRDPRTSYLRGAAALRTRPAAVGRMAAGRRPTSVSSSTVAASGPDLDRRPPTFAGVVALDGPSGTGKSTVARGLAARLGARYLDTGAMYRAATVAVLRAGVDLDDAGRGRRASSTARRSRSRPIPRTPAVAARRRPASTPRSARAEVTARGAARCRPCPPCARQLVAAQRELIDDGADRRRGPRHRHGRLADGATRRST